MKLLFDENLPPVLPGLVAMEFPGNRHVREIGLKGHSDEEVWNYAKLHGSPSFPRIKIFISMP